MTRSKLRFNADRSLIPWVETPGICGACGRHGALSYPYTMPLGRVLERYRCTEHIPEDVKETRQNERLSDDAHARSSTATKTADAGRSD